MERLGDRWGRGIRYGEDPEDPDARTGFRSGGRGLSRREALAFVVGLSDSIDGFELVRGTMLLLGQLGGNLERLVAYMSQFPEAQDPRPVAELPSAERASAEMLARGLEIAEGHLTQAPRTESLQMTMPLLLGSFRLMLDALKEDNALGLVQVRVREQELRDTLQAIAAVANEGE